MLVPFVEYLGQSVDPNRGGGPPHFPLTFLGMLVVPEYWGRPDKLVLGNPETFAHFAYLGVAPLLLAAASLSVRIRVVKVFFALLALIPLFLVFDTPLSPLGRVVRALPGLAAIQLNRTIVLTVLGLALLAGYGLDGLVSAARSQRRRMIAVMVVVGLLPVGYLLLAPADARGPRETLRQLPTIDAESLRAEAGSAPARAAPATRPRAGRGATAGGRTTAARGL